MPLLPYSLARPLLFRMDPEAAHDLTLGLLAGSQGTPLRWAYCAERVDDPIELAGLRFPNRVGLAAGLDKNARCIDALAAMGFGFVEVGTVTPLAQPGNPQPRPQQRESPLLSRDGYGRDEIPVRDDRRDDQRPLRSDNRPKHKRGGPPISGGGQSRDGERPRNYGPKPSGVGKFKGAVKRAR